jgi:hypothetical protein
VTFDKIFTQQKDVLVTSNPMTPPNSAEKLKYPQIYKRPSFASNIMTFQLVFLPFMILDNFKMQGNYSTVTHGSLEDIIEKQSMMINEENISNYSDTGNT